MAISHYSGVRNGCVQTVVFDQMGVSQPGRLYSPADLNMCDAFASLETSEDGLVCGLACVRVYITDPTVPGINDWGVRAPKAGDTVEMLAGLVIRTDATPSNAKGQACVDEGQMATVLRNTRAGGRAWVTCARGNPVADENVFVVVNSTTPDTLPNGSFVASAVDGDAIEWPGFVWTHPATAGTLCNIEARGAFRLAETENEGDE